MSKVGREVKEFLHKQGIHSTTVQLEYHSDYQRWYCNINIDKNRNIVSKISKPIKKTLNEGAPSIELRSGAMIKARETSRLVYDSHDDDNDNRHS